MRRALSTLLAIVPFAVAAQPAVEPLPVVYLPTGASYEECRMQWQTSDAVPAFSAPTPVSQHIRTIDGMRRVDANDYTEALTAVLQNGRVRTREAIRIDDAMNLTSGRGGPLSISAGEEFEVLSSASEGTAYFFNRGSLYLGTLPGFSAQTGQRGVEVLSQPVTELWVRLVEHGDDRPASWLNVSQAGVIAREAFCGG